MPSLMNRLLGKVVTLRSGEAGIVLLMFAYSFLAMTSHNILRPVTESKFIDRLGANRMPWVQLAAGILIGVIMHLYTQAIRRIPRRRVIPVTQAAIVAMLVVLWGLLRTEAVWVLWVAYLVGLLLGILLISQFWTLANDVYDARQAKRLFGFIGGGASLGGILGNGVTKFLMREVGINNLVLVSAAALAVCAGIVWLITERVELAGSGDAITEEHGVGGSEAIRLLVESPQLRVIALVIGFAAAGAAIVQQQVNMAVEATGGDAETIGELLAGIKLYVSIVGFVVQVALTSRIHRSFGIAVALLMLPVSLGASATLILMTRTLWAAGAARVLDSTLRYTVDKTTREVLFLPLPADLKYRAKPFIDVTMDRFAKALTALLMLVLISDWGLGLDWQRLSYASLTMMGVWIVVALAARRSYLESFRASIGARAIAPETIRTEISDAATIETLVEELSNPDEAAVLYAIDMLEALDKPQLVTPLLLHHESPRVRARTLRALSPTRSRMATRWTGAVERMVHDEDVDVRAAALRALATLAHEDATETMRRHLQDPEPRVAVAAAAVLADSKREPDMAAAEETLKGLITDTRETAADGRKETAHALAHIREPRFRSLLVPLLYDNQVEVVHEAIRSARHMGASDGLFLPGLILLLGHRVLKVPAREALVGYGEAIIDALGHALSDQREFIWVRRHIPATLALMPTQASMDALVASLADQDGFLRYKAIAAIEHLRRHHPSIAFPRAVIEKLVVQETSRYYTCLTLQHNLLRESAQHRGSLLDRALDDKLSRTLDRIYRLLGLLYNIDDVAAARYTIEQGEARRRAAAVEYLDNLLGGVVRKRVLPILEDTPIAEKARHANLVLKSRPRDLEDTLAQLVHDDDPVVAAAAIHFVGRQGIWTLSDDLDYVVERRSPDDRAVIEAASWTSTLRAHAGTRESVATDALPAVEIVDRLRSIPFFEFVSVDELFRIAELGEEARHQAGHELYRQGASIEEVEFLIDGRVRSSNDRGESSDYPSPHVLGLEDALQGAPSSHTVFAVEPIVCFRIRATDFMTMISDNVLLAQGLFRMLLTERHATTSQTADAIAVHPALLDRRVSQAQPVDQALLLRHHRLLARATATQLMSLVSAARDVPLAPGQVLFDAEDPAALYLVLDGDLRLESADGVGMTVTTGTTIGVAETLAGAPAGWRATITHGGRAICVDREELFAVLTDHMDLMQGLFSGVMALRYTNQAVGYPLHAP